MNRLLFWWFLLITFSGAPQVVGPFHSQKRCQAIRDSLNRGDVRQSDFTSGCWSDDAH